VAQRFRDNSIVQDLEQMGVRLDGMPEAGAPTIAHVSNADVRNAEFVVLSFLISIVKLLKVKVKVNVDLYSASS